MKKICPKCGSENVLKIVPAVSLVIPEIKKEVKAGTAKVSCGCTGTLYGVEYQCKSCHFKWDDIMERGMTGEA